MGGSDYCYRHNPELKTELERAVLQHQLDTGKKAKEFIDAFESATTINEG